MFRSSANLLGWRNQRGLTLVESLVATMILGFAVIAHIRLNATVIEDTRHASNVAAATYLAMDRIESMHGEDYSLVVAGSDGPLNEDGTTGGMFSRSWTVTDDTPVAGTKTVSVVVSWSDTTRNRDVTLQTVVVE